MIITIDTDKPLDPIDMKIVAALVLRAVTEAYHAASNYLAYAEAVLRDEGAIQEALEDERRLYAAMQAVQSYVEGKS